jgi:formylglycine-generating enzyme required for sulfatase activity
MALDRELRYQSAQEMRQELRRIKQEVEAAIAERERQEAERRRLEEAARQREIEWQRQREEATRLHALQAESASKEEAATKLKQPLPHEAVTGRIAGQTVTHEQSIDQEKAAPAAPAVRRRSPRVALIAIAAILLIAPFAYLRWNLANSTNDEGAGAIQQKPAISKNEDAVSPNPTISPSVESSPTPPPAASYVVLPARIDMVYVPAGAFMMGAPAGEPNSYSTEGPQHRVAVPGFYIGKYEVTRAQWRAVMGGDQSSLKGDNLPVTNITWDEAKDFCRKLSQMTGDEYRMPTEAEWEYACRAGTTGPYAGDLNAMAWHIENSDFESHPVGRKRPNTFGIYDMQGNVQEWCEDFWHSDYEGAPIDGSAWMDSSSSGGSRVVRGCDWSSAPFQCRSASRNNWSAGLRMDDVGFRIVRAYR